MPNQSPNIEERKYASRPYSMHPHELLYSKDSEGAAYNDGEKDEDETGDAVSPLQHISIFGRLPGVPGQDQGIRVK
jgi:hypothetical protein